MVKTPAYKTWFKRIVTQIKRIIAAWSDSQASTYGASVAYYTVFSIAPLLVIVISIVGIFLNQQDAEQSIISQFGSTFGQNGAEFIRALVQSQVSTEKNVILAIAGFVILLIGATGIFSQLQLALDTIFESLPEKNVRGLWGTIQQKLLSFGMVLSLGFLLLISLAISAFITALSGYLTTLIPNADTLAHVIELTVSFILISLFLALTYKILPSKRLQWMPSLIGGAIAGLFFVVSKYALGMYLGSSTAFTSYGAASSLVLLILWTYYMSQVFFLGAILTRLYVVPKLK